LQYAVDGMKVIAVGQQLPGWRGGGQFVRVIQGQVSVKRIFGQRCQAVGVVTGERAGGGGGELRGDEMEGGDRVRGVRRDHVRPRPASRGWGGGVKGRWMRGWYLNHRRRRLASRALEE
jgi:hypothetical protein